MEYLKVKIVIREREREREREMGRENQWGGGGSWHKEILISLSFSELEMEAHVVELILLVESPQAPLGNLQNSLTELDCYRFKMDSTICQYSIDIHIFRMLKTI